MYILKIITLLGGLALFLFGMDIMGKSLERLAGGRLQTILAKMSSNVGKGFFLGLAVTAIIQSSSATTVMVVGFVNSGIMSLKQAMTVEPLEQVVDTLVKEIKSRHVRRLRDGQCTVEYGFVLEDLLTAFQRTADHCSNVAVEMLQVSEGKLEAHEYLNALKAGQLQESAKFSERFLKFKQQYAFPENTAE
ncbi:MAG: hypothetical protein E7433_03370 [Ruminococcaceae bacterium]|nr:hypothetical protein [Oscillospiraceae bacterium]